MKRSLFASTLLTAAMMLSACEDIIDPELEPAGPVLAVDAWINNLPGAQTINLTQSQPYFEAQVPTGVTGAAVLVRDDQGRAFVFLESLTKPGNYEWTPSGSDTLRVGGKYQLEITLGTEFFVAESYMGRVPPIDSVTFDEDDNLATGEKIIRAEFWGTDLIGQNDAYWIRTYKNGVPLLKPAEINIAYDAGLSVGGPADGVVFIAPIRRRINSVDRNADGELISPITENDSMHVQIHSLTVAAFAFLNEVSIQTNRPGGFQELFATPLANVSTNLRNSNSAGSKVVGFFNVSAVSANGARYNK